MKLRNILFLIIAISLPAITEAADVPWISESYTITLSDWDSSMQLTSGPILPIEASYASAYAKVTNSSMYVEVSDFGNEAMTAFTGRYIANDPYFLFQYDHVIELNEFAIFAVSEYVNNQLYRNLYADFLHDGSDTISVPTPIGSDIEVHFYMDVYTMWPSTSSSSLDYNMSVGTAIVPEPISSILFITGGILLAGRRYIRRKA